MKKDEEETTTTMDLDEAVLYFEKLKSASNFVDPHMPYIGLGKVYLMKGMMIKAREEFTEALKLDPFNQEALNLLDSLERSIH